MNKINQQTNLKSRMTLHHTRNKIQEDSFLRH